MGGATDPRIFPSGRENKGGIQRIGVGEGHVFKGSEISFYGNHRCYGSKVCRSVRRGAISIPQPASLVGNDVDHAEEWEQGTPSPPLHPIPPTPSSTSWLPLHPGIWFQSRLRLQAQARHQQVPSLNPLRLRCSFPGDLDRLRIVFVCHPNLWNSYPVKKWKDATWGEKKQPTWGHWPWLLEVKGERSGR